MKSVEEKIRGRLTQEQMQLQAGDIKQRSVTPDTHKVRYINDELTSNPNFLNALLGNPEQFFAQEPEILAEINNSYYVDAYSHPSLETSRVLHFGINTHREELRGELEIHNKQQSEISENISQSSGSTANHQKASNNILLTDLEKYITNTAINFINQSGQKTILVDVFERKNGLIENPETHTVVLYNAGNKIIVVDPNNPQFSSHLFNLQTQEEYTGGLAIEVDYSNKNKIYTPTITTENPTGPNNFQWRDCIDVAVKLSFAINKQSDIDGIITNITSSDAVRSITNQATLYKALPSKVEKYPLRIKQASDVNQCEKATTFLTLLQTKWKNYQQKIKPEFQSIF